MPGPLVHFVFNSAALLFAAQYFSAEISGPVFFAIAVGSVAADFDHRKPVYYAMAALMFYFVFQYAFEATNGVAQAVASGVLGVILMKLIERKHEPTFKNSIPASQRNPGMWKEKPTVYTWGYLVAFTMLVYVLSQSLELASWAGLSWALHWGLDWFNYATWFGLKVMDPITRRLG